jgi:hypothetical protein
MCLRYGLGDQRNVVPFPAGATDLSRLQSTQFGFVVHPANYLIGTVGLTPRGVRLTSLHTLTLPAIETRSPIPQSVTKLPSNSVTYFTSQTTGFWMSSSEHFQTRHLPQATIRHTQSPLVAQSFLLGLNSRSVFKCIDLNHTTILNISLNTRYGLTRQISSNQNLRRAENPNGYWPHDVRVTNLQPD